jgi:pimeloyl-ACP methyl ester carboxylesterase
LIDCSQKAISGSPTDECTRSGIGGKDVPLMLTEATSIDYDVHGEGPTLILINGLGFGRWAWFKQVPTLSRHFRTITFDVRGERYLKDGVADLTADVVALLEHLGVRKTHVLAPLSVVSSPRS